MKKEKFISYEVFQAQIGKFNYKSQKIDVVFHTADHRCWAALISPEQDNIIVVHSINKYDLGDIFFDIITQDKVITDVEPEDIYDEIGVLLGKVDLIENE